jgi:hypothetical protein
MRLLHYPPQSPTELDLPNDRQIGIGSHTECVVPEILPHSRFLDHLSKVIISVASYEVGFVALIL